MFGLFSNKNKNECPVDNDTRLWMEHAFLWLVDIFEPERIINKDVLLPNTKYFPFRYDGSPETLYKTAAVVADQMDVDTNEINLQLYNNTIHEVGATYTKMDKSGAGKLSAGLYYTKDETGKYNIFIESSNLSIPENLVAVIAHGFARVIMLDREMAGMNHGILADMSTVMLGLGIFNANASYRFYKDQISWGHKSIGFLNQQQWAYILALYAYYRNERNPPWADYLSKTIQGDLKRSLQFIYENTDKVFNEKYLPPSKTGQDEFWTGKWIGEYAYGKDYSAQYRNSAVPFELEMFVVDGALAGTSFDETARKIFDEPATIEGFINNNSILFTLEYPCHWSRGETGEVIINRDRRSHRVLYKGEFNGDRFVGTWEIKSERLDEFGAYYTHVSTGRWSMYKPQKNII